MKKILLLFTLLVTTAFFGQLKGDISIQWAEKSRISIGESKIIVPQFNPKNFQLDSYKKQLFFCMSTKINVPIDENNIQISNVVYENIALDQLGDIAVAELPSQINFKVINARSRQDLFAQISLSPIIKDGSSIKRVKSLSYSIMYATAQRRLTTNPEYTQFRFIFWKLVSILC